MDINYMNQQIKNAGTGENTNARPSDMIKKMYEESLKGQQAKLKANLDIAKSGLTTQLEKLPEAYQGLRNDAALQKEIQARKTQEYMANLGLSGAGGASRTEMQRNNLNYLNQIGSVNRQEQQSVDDINTAISQLTKQYNAEDQALIAQNEAGKLSDLLNNYQWQSQFDAAQTDSNYNKALNLLSGGWITADQFEKMTGTHVQAKKTSSGNDNSYKDYLTYLALGISDADARAMSGYDGKGKGDPGDPPPPPKYQIDGESVTGKQYNLYNRGIL